MISHPLIYQQLALKPQRLQEPAQIFSFCRRSAWFNCEPKRRGSVQPPSNTLYPDLVVKVAMHSFISTPLWSLQIKIRRGVFEINDIRVSNPVSLVPPSPRESVHRRQRAGTLSAVKTSVCLRFPFMNVTWRRKRVLTSAAVRAQSCLHRHGGWQSWSNVGG